MNFVPDFMELHISTVPEAWVKIIALWMNNPSCLCVMEEGATSLVRDGLITANGMFKACLDLQDLQVLSDPFIFR